MNVFIRPFYLKHAPEDNTSLQIQPPYLVQFLVILLKGLFNENTPPHIDITLTGSIDMLETVREVRLSQWNNRNSKPCVIVW